LLGPPPEHAEVTTRQMPAAPNPALMPITLCVLYLSNGKLAECVAKLAAPKLSKCRSAWVTRSSKANVP
jgi:hypothetical protein